MDYERNRRILADVDGVLLDWESAFDAWMKQKGYTIGAPEVYKQSVRYALDQHHADRLVEQFNECAWIGFLKPLRDSVDAIQKLASQHWHIECITSLSTDHWAGELRRLNLERWFGRGTIRRVRCLETGADKDAILKEYEPGHWWIEDKPENCEAGLKAGHKPILINHEYNKHYSNNNIKRASTWKEVLDIIEVE